MQKQQRYVSDELTHFVGRGLSDENAQYDLLLEIIRSRVLKSPGSSDIVEETTPAGPRTHVKRKVTVFHDNRLSSNQKYSASVLCFADIPLEDLHLHIRKYSAFGVSFQKRFLIAKGANPVFYVASQSPTDVRNPLANDSSSAQEELRRIHRERGGFGFAENFSRAELFDEAELAQQQLFSSPEAHPSQRLGTVVSHCGPDLSPSTREILHEFLQWYLFPYMKFFDPELPDDHLDNYYMEREWRVVGAMKFQLEDIERILIPRAVGGRLRKDLPEYVGQVTFTA